MVEKIVFFGNYPNNVDVNLSIFFRNLIYAFADLGIECTVVDPVSITKYRKKVFSIPVERIEQTKNGHEVKVYSPKYVSFSSKVIGKIDTHVWSVKAYRRAALKQLTKRKIEFDVTYGHFINIGGVSACRAGRKYCKPSFVANGESDLKKSTYHYGSPYDIDDFKYCTGVISVSGKNKSELVNLGLIPESRIRVFPNAVDDSLFHKMDKAECRKKLKFRQDEIIACFVGGFSDRKGDKRVIKAAENIPNLKLAFAGQGKSKPTGKNVIFADSVPHDELPVLLNACDFFVLPTLNEGCCNAIIEALACGLPIVSSNLSFNDEILNDENSIKVDPNSIEEIESAMKKLFYNKELRETMSQAALNHAKNMTITERAKKILLFMNQMMGRENEPEG